MTVPSAQIWKAFSSAIGVELRDDTVIRGASGIEHQVQAVAVDDKTQRVVIVSAEADPRTAALVQIDVQASMPQAKVLVARPIAIDVSAIARSILSPFNIKEIEFQKAKTFIDEINRPGSKLIESSLAPFIENMEKGYPFNLSEIFENVQLPTIDQIVSVISQSASLPWRDIFSLLEGREVAGARKLDFSKLLERDTIEADLQVGVCPIPLYQFSGDDFELFLSATRIDECQQRMKDIGIYQYFFPAPDQLALALVEKRGGNRNEILLRSDLAPEMGHPFGELEILESTTKFKDILDNLNDKKLVVEGEFGFELSEKGSTARGLVKFSPREGLVTKIINRISLSLSPSDFLR